MTRCEECGYEVASDGAFSRRRRLLASAVAFCAGVVILGSYWWIDLPPGSLAAGALLLFIAALLLIRAVRSRPEVYLAEAPRTSSGLRNQTETIELADPEGRNGTVEVVRPEKGWDRLAVIVVLIDGIEAMRVGEGETKTVVAAAGPHSVEAVTSLGCVGPSRFTLGSGGRIRVTLTSPTNFAGAAATTPLGLFIRAEWGLRLQVLE